MHSDDRIGIYASERAFMAELSQAIKAVMAGEVSANSTPLAAHLAHRLSILEARQVPARQHEFMLRQYAMDWRIARTAALEA